MNFPVLQVEVFWVMTPCNAVVRYQLSRGPCYLHIQSEVGGTKVLWNVGILQHNTTRCHNPEDLYFNHHLRESFKYHFSFLIHWRLAFL